MIDVCIVGAGPAGSSAALQLARRGFAVTLIERARFPRVKVCGDYLCPGVAMALRDLGIADEVLAQAHPITSILLSGFGAAVRLDVPGEGAFALPREVLDARILEASRAAGVRLVGGAFLRAQQENRSVRVTYRDEHGVERDIVTSVLVGADGAWSAVAQRMGMVGDSRRTGRWAVGGKLRPVPDSNELEMHVGPDGYYARNPLTKDSANSMLVLPKPAALDEADRLVDTITSGARRFEPAKITRPVAVGPLRYRADRVANGRVLLGGDAAELLDPFTGQGVACALQTSAHIALAAQALLAGNPEQRVARSYQAAWESVVGPRRKLTKLINAVITRPFLRARALRSLTRNADAARQLLASVSGVVPAPQGYGPRTLVQLLAS